MRRKPEQFPKKHVLVSVLIIYYLCVSQRVGVSWEVWSDSEFFCAGNFSFIKYSHLKGNFFWNV